MVTESWEMAQNLQGDAVLCQDQRELKMKAQMSIFFNLHMTFEPGLTQIQDGGKIPIGSHLTFSLFLMNFRCMPALMIYIIIDFKSDNTSAKPFLTFSM